MSGPFKPSLLEWAVLSVQLVSLDSWFDLTSDGVSPTTFVVSPAQRPLLDKDPNTLNYPYYPDNPEQYLNTLETEDSPAIPLSDDEGELQRNFAATMFVLWDPILPDGCIPATSQAATQCSSIPVPIGSISWGFSGATVNTQQLQNSPNPNGVPNNTTWLVNNCGGCSSPLTFVPSQPAQVAYGYPTWQGAVPH